jgi:hypothetical protein
VARAVENERKREKSWKLQAINKQLRLRVLITDAPDDHNHKFRVPEEQETKVSDGLKNANQ